MTESTYSKDINSKVTGFTMTSTGPIAKIEGFWYSVNGILGDIIDIRYALTKEELTKYSVSND